MKKFVLLIILITASFALVNNYPTIKKEAKLQYSEWEMFVKALILVESNGNPKAIGKHNDVGILQITPIYVEEVNRILKSKTYSLECRYNVKKCLEMFEVYQGYYNPERDINKAITLHNPKAPKSYRTKIIKLMHKIKTNLS